MTSYMPNERARRIAAQLERRRRYEAIIDAIYATAETRFRIRTVRVNPRYL